MAKLFPLRLDGATQTVSAAATWNKLTSYVDVDTDGAYAFTLVDAVDPGTILTVYRSATGSSEVDVDYNSVTLHTLDAATESCMLMWTGSSWETLSNSSASGSISTTNLTMTGNLVVQGNADIGNAATDTVGFYGATKVAQQAGAAQAAVTAETDLPAAGAGAGATYTQAEVTAAIENIHDLIALTNEIRQCLVDLGLIKGAA